MSDEGIILLNELVTDFKKRIGHEPVSLQQCLRRICSRKQRSCKVEHDNNPTAAIITLDALNAACRIIHEVYLPSTMEASDTMLCIQHLSVIIGVIRLVLESAKNEPLTTEFNATALAMPMPITITMPTVMAMTIEILQGLSKSISTLFTNTMEDVTSTNETNPNDIIHPGKLDPKFVASFLTAALLRTINPYVLTMPFLLSPLWKLICNIASRGLATPELAKESLIALISYLSEGERQCNLSSIDNLTGQSKEHYFHIKVMSFLMARLLVLLPAYLNNMDDDSDDIETNQEIYFMVCRIYGIRLASPALNDETMIQQYTQLELKAENCIDTILTCKEGKRCEPFIKQLLSATNGGRSFCPGKLLIFQRFLGRPPTEDPELLLLVCHDLVFSTIPKCFVFFTNPSGKDSTAFDTLLSTSIRLISNVLIHCELGQKSTTPLNRRQLHGILLKWLAPLKRLHPASREVLLSSISHFSCLLAMSSPCESPRAVEMTPRNNNNSAIHATLAKILLDPRTQRIFRENVAGVLTRILTCTNVTGCQSIARFVVEEEFASCLKKHAVTMKRKRPKPSIDFSFSQLGVNHICIISSVLKCVKKCDNAYLKERVDALCCDLEENQVGAFCIGKSRSVEVALLLAYISGLLTDKESKDGNHLSFKFGSECEPFLLQTSQWFVENCKRQQARVLNKGMISVVLSTLDLLGSGLAYTGGRSTSQQLVTLVVESLTMCTKMLDRHIGVNQRYAMLLVFEVTSLLGKIGSVIRSNCPNEIVLSIASTFKSLFFLNLWPVSAEAMTSLTNFASTLPSAYQGILPKCFPLELQALLKARLLGMVHRRNTSHAAEDSLDVHSICAKMLSKLLVPNMPTSLRSTTTLVSVIEPGSYMLSMPTTEGRSALVIFAPGDQSIEDIKHMLGTDCIDDVGIQVLQRIKVLGPDANGCRLLSKSTQ